MSKEIAELPINEQWLKEVGFKWHQLERQPHKQWLLWLGDALDKISSYEDLGIEVSFSGWPTECCWNCWLRSDVSHRYSRFVHIRRLQKRSELISLVEAITGQAWNPENHFYGCVRRPEMAERLRKEHERIDLKLMRDGYRWLEIEKDDSRGQALPEHYEAHEKAKIDKL
jgi:hypothetical protein